MAIFVVVALHKPKIKNIGLFINCMYFFVVYRGELDMDGDAFSHEAL
jgi:hypothetical protein